jgi:3-methyladenine DNA glycosylase AlkD
MISNLLKEIFLYKDNNRSKILKSFFKTKKGEYGEGDKFLGVSVPLLRKISNKYYNEISLKNIEILLKNKYHEVRFVGVILLNKKFKKNKKEVFNIYIKHIGKGINNWDLIDVSAPLIIGEYISTLSIKEKFSFIDKSILNDNLWVNRMIVLSSFYDIKNKDNEAIFYIASKMFKHKHDLIHKSVGWMLREVGKNTNETTLINFLNKYHKNMPRVMLRYSIEKLDQSIRKIYLKK